MRSRNIKPGFFKNDELGECHPLARILFVGLWCMADREGRLENRPKKIKAEILPYDDIDICKMLEQLLQGGFIALYEVNGIEYCQIVNWHKHQNPHHMEAGSEIPPMQGGENRFNDKPITASQRNRILNRDGRRCAQCGSTKDLQVDHIFPRSNGGTSVDSNLQVLCKTCNLKKGACTDRGQTVDESYTERGRTLIPDSLLLIPDSNINTASDDAAPENEVGDFYITKTGKKLTGEKLESFERFWEAFNYKKGKAEAAEEWRKLKINNGDLDKILGAAQAEANNRAGLIQRGCTPKWAQGWLSGRRWEDEHLIEGGACDKYNF